MGRGLMLVSCHVGKAKLCLMNTHLESTKEYADERKWQTRKCFKKALKVDEDVTVVFGGDLNARDKEIEEIGGVPAGMDDLWVRTGARKDFEFTWDMRRNTNLEFPGKFKPRCRFDRLYIRDAHPKRVEPEHFVLFGIERVPGCQRFPSDHWGILTDFRVKSNE